MTRIASLLFVLTVTVSLATAESHWPGWLGPRRDGKSLDTGLLKQWPEIGPKLVWKVDDIGVGFSSVAVVGGRLYLRYDTHLYCFDVAAQRPASLSTVSARALPLASTR